MRNPYGMFTPEQMDHRIKSGERVVCWACSKPFRYMGEELGPVTCGACTRPGESRAVFEVKTNASAS